MEVHKGSQETYDHLAQWVAPDFFFSRKDQWERFGMLAVFGDYVLNCTHGDIGEIGVGESSLYLTQISKKYNRRIYHCDIAASKIINPMTVKGYLSEDYTYLEPGMLADSYKRAVFFAGASDDFFQQVRFTKLALAFIDGDHVYDQVKKDFWNFVPLMVENGYIILHDTMPPTEEYLSENLCGTVYKLRQEIEADKRFDCITLPKGCAIGVGLTIVRVKPERLPYYNE